MPLELGVPTKDEFLSFVPMMFEAMGGMSAYVNAVWPHNLTQEGQKKHADAFAAHAEADPSVRWYKVTDQATGRIISASQWLFYKDQKPPEWVVDGPPGTWDNDLEKEYAQAMWTGFMQARWKVFRENDLPLASLNIMATAYDFRHHGAGTMMMKEALKAVDEMDALCTVESSTGARWLYEQHGFVVRSHDPLELPDKFADRQKKGDRLFFMVRERKSKRESN